jgi:hypothetical protein
MVSVRKLEKLLEPYRIGSGASSEFTDYDEFRKGDIKVRIDGNCEVPYKKQLENAAKKFGMI